MRTGVPLPRLLPEALCLCLNPDPPWQTGTLGPPALLSSAPGLCPHPLPAGPSSFLIWERSWPCALGGEGAWKGSPGTPKPSTPPSPKLAQNSSQRGRGSIPRPLSQHKGASCHPRAAPGAGQARQMNSGSLKPLWALALCISLCTWVG